MSLNSKVSSICLYCMFLLMIFWDVLENIMPYSQYAVLIILLLICVSTRRMIKYNKYYLIIICIVFLHGLINIYFGNNSLELLVKQVGVISVCFCAYDNLISRFTVNKIFEAYFKASFFMSAAGVIMQVYSLYKGNFYYRMTSFCSEPSFLCYFLAPTVCLIVFFIVVPEIVDKELNLYKKKFQLIVIMFAYLTTFSFTAYIGLGIMLIMAFYCKRISINKFIIPLLGIVIFYSVYMNVPDIKMRIDDTISIFSVSDKYSANLSSYTIYNNIQVSLKAFKQNYGLGVGLGAYQNMFDKYSLSLGQGLSDVYFMNREDANSAFLRLLTEVGLVGIIFVFWWLKRFYVKSKTKYRSYSCAVLCLLVLFLIRQGNYVHGGSVMIWCLYMKIWKEQNSQIIRKE